jgi:hypothetical protein
MMDEGRFHVCAFKKPGRKRMGEKEMVHESRDAQTLLTWRPGRALPI